MFTLLTAYPKIYSLGHPSIAELLTSPVIIEEKVDGSQFSFGKFETPNGDFVVSCRSKNQELILGSPEPMFLKAIQTVNEISYLLTPNWTYRAEFVSALRHNTLTYNRVPKGYLVLFDVLTESGEWLAPTERSQEAERLGIDSIPVLRVGNFTKIEEIHSILDTESFLGGANIEGVVIKNPMKKLMGKWVCEKFKETNSKLWKKDNPTVNDVVQNIIDGLRTVPRWEKAIQHLREAGQLESSPTDIALLIREIPKDIEQEEKERIKDVLYQWAWPHIKRGVTKGLSDWYKEKLLKRQFEDLNSEGIPS